MSPKNDLQETRVLKLVAALILSLFCAALVYGQQPAPTCEPPEITDLARDELKGPVKTIKVFETEFEVSEKTGRLEKRPRQLQRETEYDASGWEGEPGVTYKVPAGMELTGTRYVCEKNGKVKELQFIAKDGSTYPRTTHVYDEKGQQTEETDYYQDGSIETKDTNVYDASGNVIELVHTWRIYRDKFPAKQDAVYLTLKYTYRYDARGNKIEQKKFTSKGELLDSRFFNYDSSDRLIKETWMDKFGRLERQRFHEYDADGRLQLSTSFGNACDKREEEGCKGSINSGDGIFNHAFKTKYQYDSQGNTIKETQWYMDGERKKPRWELTEIIEREITYHPTNTQ